jgi:hypothetical protein
MRILSLFTIMPRWANKTPSRELGVVMKYRIQWAKFFTWVIQELFKKIAHRSVQRNISNPKSYTQNLLQNCNNNSKKWDAVMSIDEEKVTDSEWNRRVLCSDESCIGVIGPDGRCKECGRRYEGELPASFSQPSDPSAADTSPTVQARHPTDLKSASPADRMDAEEDNSVVADEEWERRRLCDDGNCIGTIGPDGRCSTCGKPTAGSAS